ncbi:MAG: histidine--tRNA ligase [Proteobacteria bacterium]|nr:histidine--tRNA ligase [Pseudomonadota bacterium]MBU1709383.1 histidine--tRNA ligase [Pseudomonadota bacterium]
MELQALKGFKDILPGESESWQWLEAKARNIFQRFGFSEIKVPILEKTELFARSIGEATDIVEKEMYTLIDRNGESITMRPEGTAPVLRAFIENALHTRQPVQRLFTIGPMFRHENPQKGRLRQFHQMSVEVIGTHNPKLDAEVMAMAWTLLDECGLTASLEINSLGCKACRPAYRQALTAFLAGIKDTLCEDCKRRTDTNPLRVLDCKNPECRNKLGNAPSILDNLCSPCNDHFVAVKNGMEILNVPFTVNSFMVRGLDYYTRTTFELVTDQLGAQSAVGAGGRYDGLVEQLGGPDLPGFGFGIGMERVLLLMEQKNILPPAQEADLFIAALGDNALEKAYALLQVLRVKGLKASMDIEGRSLKSQMKQANRVNARFTLILGEDELAKGQGVLRDMSTKEQQEISFTDIDAIMAATKK